MRTTINVDDDLMRRAKEAAARSGRTLAQVVEDALRQAFGPPRIQPPREPVHLPTFGGQGLQPGVDLDSGASLLDVMEDRDPA